MKTIGLIGGMSWESTIEYYRIINQAVAERLGGLHSAKVLLYSVDFAEIEALQRSADWEEAARRLTAVARNLEVAGADFVLVCTNTMHKLAPELEAAISIPLVHIADPTAAAIREAGIVKVGLLGTRFTMEQDFYRVRLQERHGLEVLTPEAGERELIHRVIFDELCLGRTENASRQAFRTIMARLVERGAQAIVLGCTEIGLLIGQEDCRVPLFDTTRLHAHAAVELAMN